MKQILRFLAFCAVFFYAAIALWVRPISQKAVQLALREDEKHGLEVSDLRFENAYLSSLQSVTWSGVSGKFRFLSRGDLLLQREFFLSVDKITLKFKNLKQRKFGLHASGLNLRTSGPEEGKDRLEHVEGQDFEIKFVLDFLHPRTIPEQAKSWARGLGDLLVHGRTTWPVSFSGATRLTFRNKPARVRLSVQKKGDEYVLVMYEQDVKDLAHRLNEHISDAEIGIIAGYPLRAPALLKISDYASTTANAISKKQTEVSENCYRHVLWSFLLTRQYGEVFAKQVTDAHEMIPDIEGDRDIDLRNNEVGRRFALEGTAEAAILNRLLTDRWAVLNAAYWPKVKHRKPPQPRKRSNR